MHKLNEQFHRHSIDINYTAHTVPALADIPAAASTRTDLISPARQKQNQTNGKEKII